MCLNELFNPWENDFASSQMLTMYEDHEGTPNPLLFLWNMEEWLNTTQGTVAQSCNMTFAWNTEGDDVGQGYCL
jgi:hypothetical protein